MKEEWLMSGAVVPVDVETTAALVAEIKRLIDVVGGMALAQPAQREWVGLTDDELKKIWYDMKHLIGWYSFQESALATEAKLKERNS